MRESLKFSIDIAIWVQCLVRISDGKAEVEAKVLYLDVGASSAAAARSRKSSRIHAKATSSPILREILSLVRDEV